MDGATLPRELSARPRLAALGGEGPLDPDLAIAVDGAPEVVLRPLREDHREGIFRNLNHRSVWRNVTDHIVHPYTLDEADRWIALNRSEAPPGANFAIERAGEAIGCTGARRGDDLHRLSAEIGYWLGPDHWGRGIATATLRTLTRWFFERSDLERLQANVLEWNPASGRVLEKAGYRQEARLRRAIVKDGEIIDGLLYARLRSDPA